MYPLVLFTHLLEIVDMGDKTQRFSWRNRITVFSLHTMLGRKLFFTPILRLLDNFYVQSVWAELFNG